MTNGQKGYLREVVGIVGGWYFIKVYAQVKRIHFIRLAIEDMVTIRDSPPHTELKQCASQPTSLFPHKLSAAPKGSVAIAAVPLQNLQVQTLPSIHTLGSHTNSAQFPSERSHSHRGTAESAGPATAMSPREQLLAYGMSAELAAQHAAPMPQQVITKQIGCRHVVTDGLTY